MISDLKKNLVIWLLLLSFTRPVICCLPKNGGSIRRSPRTPFYLHQKVPDIDEYSQGASGQPGDPINYSRAFKVLKTNYNPGIVFEQKGEKTGDTRLMSKVCTCCL